MSQIYRRCSNTAQSTMAVGPAASQRVRGFTLIELLITIAVAAILIMVAVPSFTNIIVSNKLTTTANDLVGSINLARMEAIKRNATTQVCANTSNGTDTLGTACTTQTGAVYVLTNGAASSVRAGTTGISTPIVLTGNMVPIRFGGQGLGHLVTSTAPYDGLIVDISTSAIKTNNHRCIRMTAGSILATTPSSVAC